MHHLVLYITYYRILTHNKISVTGCSSEMCILAVLILYEETVHGMCSKATADVVSCIVPVQFSLQQHAVVAAQREDSRK